MSTPSVAGHPAADPALPLDDTIAQLRGAREVVTAALTSLKTRDAWYAVGWCSDTLDHAIDALQHAQHARHD